MTFFSCVFGKCHCSHGSMNNLPENFGLPFENALNSEMGATCPNVAVLPANSSITMTTYNGTVTPAGTSYGKGTYPFLF